MLGWWYVCIGGAFVLLGFRSAVRGDPGWSVVFRFVIAAGFAALGAGTLRGRRP
jgi:tetrahydromethanopterin S-methyltransferase subunit C